MNFLQICQKTGLRSGHISSQNQMATTINQSGRQLKIVDAVQQAWTKLQLSRQDWEFMRATFNHALVIGQATYAPADLGITATDFSRFAQDVPDDCYFPMHLYDTALGTADDTPIVQIAPERWSMVYGRGAQINTRPYQYALRLNSISLGPTPDKAYTCIGAYWKAPQQLALDADVPIMPAHFHDVIVWQAIKLISGMEGAFADRLVATSEGASLYRQLVNEQTRPVRLGGVLA